MDLDANHEFDEMIYEIAINAGLTLAAKSGRRADGLVRRGEGDVPEKRLCRAVLPNPLHDIGGHGWCLS